MFGSLAELGVLRRPSTSSLNSSVLFWITPYGTRLPEKPVPASYNLPYGAVKPLPPHFTVEPIPVTVQVGANVVIRWHYPASDPIYTSFFYFEVTRDETIITPQPIKTTGVPTPSFVLRAAMWVDTAPPPNGRRESYTYYIRAVSASNKKSPPLTSSIQVT
jgi:hypothetical protein